MSISLGTILPIAIGAIIAVAVLSLLIMGYVKAPPDTAYIISGMRKKVGIGKASIRIPFFERIDKVSLKLIPIDVKTATSVPTADYINIRVDAVVNVKVSDNVEKLKLAAQNFLNQSPDYIGRVAREVLEGNMREIVGQMKLEEMVSDRQKFADMVKQNAAPDLAGMGLDIVSFNVQNFIDDNQVIENLGVDNIVKISKDAAVSRANAEKEIAIAQAQAAKESNDAKVAADLEIANAKARAQKEKAIVTAKAEQESREATIEADTQIALKQNELDIKKAELQKDVDTKQAIADAAKDIQAEEQRKIYEIKNAEANLARQEKEIELKEREVAIKEKSLEATVKKEAEAKKYAAQQALAEAVKEQGIAEAEAARAKGEAEAAAIKAKAEAEAEGLMKKAEAMAAYGDAAKQDMQLQALKVYFEQLPAIAEAAGKAYTNVDKIYMYGGDTSQLAGDIMKNVTQVSEGLSQSLGIDLKTVLASFMGGSLASGGKGNVTVNANTSVIPSDEI